MTLDAQIEAILFWKAEPVEIGELGKIFNQPEEAIRTAIIFLRGKLTERGIVLIENNNQVMLGTNPESSALIEKLTKEELAGELGRAGLETISIILYRGPIARAEIDYIRGVNSSFILRHLQIRGLVEKIANPKDARSFLYRPTFDLLRHLGVSKVEDLPEYGQVSESLSTLTAES